MVSSTCSLGKSLAATFRKVTLKFSAVLGFFWSLLTGQETQWRFANSHDCKCSLSPVPSTSRRAYVLQRALYFPDKGKVLLFRLLFLQSLLFCNHCPSLTSFCNTALFVRLSKMMAFVDESQWAFTDYDQHFFIFFYM